MAPRVPIATKAMPGCMARLLVPIRVHIRAAEAIPRIHLHGCRRAPGGTGMAATRIHIRERCLVGRRRPSHGPEVTSRHNGSPLDRDVDRIAVFYRPG